VTLRAQNAPIRAILSEWARLGGATIVNGDRVAGSPLTLELTGVPERQALDVVLRNVAGYMLAPRRAGTRGASAFDRILILPTSVAPVSAPPAAAGARPAPPVRRPPVIARPLTPVPEPEQGDEPSDVAQGDPSDVQPPTDTAQPPAPPVPQPRVIRPPVMRPPVPGGSPEIVPEQPEPEVAEPAAPAGAPTPNNPFGLPVGSSATPGVIAPAPKPQAQPANRVQ
jgi:hypothetical protein